jgi:citrate synthase
MNASVHIRLADIMSTPVVTGAPGESLRAVTARMETDHVGSVVIVDDGSCVGILTERDLIRAVAAGAQGGAPVADIMSKPVQTLPPDASWEQATSVLFEHGFRHIPVTDGGRLVGLVSLRDLMKQAYLMVESKSQREAEPYEAPPGLANVAVARTEVSDVLGRKGFYHYRGYNAVELARRGRVEDAWHLMLRGELPGPAQREAFIAETAALRHLPAGLRSMLPGIARLGPPGSLESLRTAVSLGAQVMGCRPWTDQSQEETASQAIRLCAMMPTLVASLFRLATGAEPVEPREDLGYCANYLYMITGEEPTEQARYAVERYLILTIDHGFNASTFTARVIASTGSDLGSVVSGAIGSLYGPFHGGAPARVFTMLDAIGSPDNAERWLRDAILGGEKLMGFGHRVYKTVDPRSELLHEVAQQLHSNRVGFAEHVEKTAVRLLAELKPGRELYANVEFYAGVVLEAAGLPREVFSATFAASRVIGWMANVGEQIASNRIFRPLAHYVGPEAPRELPASWQPGQP